MSVLSNTLFHLRGQLLGAAEKCIPDVGFTNEALARAIDTTGKRAETTDSALSQMFQRGFPSALVEHVVKRSNLHAQHLLEAKYNKKTIISAIAANEENFSLGRLALPSGKNVAEDALLAKVAFLQPFAGQWPDAVAIEWQPSNAPYTIIGLTEFVDTTAYYMERVDNLGKLLEPARRIMNARIMASYIPSDSDPDASVEEARTHSASADFLYSFVRGVPLASGPHLGGSAFKLDWYTRRAALGVLYGLTVASLLGDASREAVETRNLVKSLVGSLV